jgi:hypothetical protein
MLRTPMIDDENLYLVEFWEQCVFCNARERKIENSRSSLRKIKQQIGELNRKRLELENTLLCMGAEP